MKNKFRSYFKPTNEEFDEMWNDGVIAYDANVLLNFYRYSERTNQVFINIFEKAKEQIWIPNQSVKEFFENRLTVIHEGLKNYDIIQKSIKGFYSNIEQELTEKRKQPFIEDYKELLAELNSVIENIEDKLNESKIKYEKLFVLEDPIMLLLAGYLDGKVGEPYSEDEIKEIQKKAKDRFDEHIPPGYKDYEKKKNRYGDYVLWCQLMDYASANKKHIIFVTDEKKEDWWYKYDNYVLGPRPELRLEMYQNAEAQFYMYSPENFINYSKKYFRLTVDEESVKEVAETSKKVIELQNIRREKYLKESFDIDIDLRQLYDELINSSKIPEETLRQLRELASRSYISEDIKRQLRELASRSYIPEETLRQLRELASRSYIPEETLRQLREMLSKLNRQRQIVDTPPR